jgi:hypothetical protein
MDGERTGLCCHSALDNFVLSSDQKYFKNLQSGKGLLASDQSSTLLLPLSLYVQDSTD